MSPPRLPFFSNNKPTVPMDLARTARLPITPLRQLPQSASTPTQSSARKKKGQLALTSAVVRATRY